MFGEAFEVGAVSKRFIAWSMVSVVILGALMLVWLRAQLLDLRGRPVPPGDEPFVQSVWLDARTVTDERRMAMRKSAACEVSGLPKDKVRAILGEPDRVESEPPRWWYRLGNEPGPFGIDWLWFVLDFSVDGDAIPSELTD